MISQLSAFLASAVLRKRICGAALRHFRNQFEPGTLSFAVFFDPLFRVVEASRNDEARDAIVGFDATGRLLFVVHVEVDDEFIRIISARRATNEEGETMSIPERIKTRLAKDRPMTTITLRIPFVDVVDSLKEIAPHKGFSGYQALLKSYISEGMRRDEALFAFGQTARLIEALKKHGVSESVIDEATRELAA